MSRKNPANHPGIRSTEWGRKARKRDDRLRGHNNAARRLDIAERMAETR